MQATLGSILINSALPESLRDYGRVWDKKTTEKVLDQLAHLHPEQYKDVVARLHDIGGLASYSLGYTVALKDLEPLGMDRPGVLALRKAMDAIQDDPGTTAREKRTRTADLLDRRTGEEEKRVFDTALLRDNPLARAALAGARGNSTQLNGMIGSTIMMMDHRDEAVPIPVTGNFSDGLSPAEYWATSHGTRKGAVSTKMSTADAGFLCLAEDTRVRLADGGSRPICKLKVGDRVVGSNRAGESFPTTVTAVFANGLRPCLTYTTDSGHKLTCTEEHRVLAEDLHSGKPTVVQSKRACYLWNVDAGQFQPIVQDVVVGDRMTFDIEVDCPEHLFVLGNGLVVSNSKQMALAAGRLKSTDDDEYAPLPGVGLPVDADDTDNIGATLAADVGVYKAGTRITPEMMQRWPAGLKQILVRSAISDVAYGGGVPQSSLGDREGGLSETGDNVGIAAMQSITERMSQGALSTKHKGGAGGRQFGGFKIINQLFQVPKVFPSGAAHAAADGAVDRIEDAPQGGKYVHIGEAKHYVAPDQAPTVKPGDFVEAGDALSDGLPNPAVVVAHKGIGEGRRYFMQLMGKVLKSSRINTHRRNLELASRAVINHVQVRDESEALPGALPGDILEYDRLAHQYQPREGALELPTGSAKHGYLEKPALHYSIGTRLTPSVLKTLKQHRVKSVTVHPEPAPFEPYMERLMTQTLRSPDWIERLGGFYIGKGFLDSVHRGAESDLRGPSYIPRLVAGQPLTDRDEAETRSQTRPPTLE